MAELTNCESCGKLFVQVTTPICPSCRKELDQKFDVVWKFIRKRENREATVTEIHHATDVEERLIFQWIKEGRLHVKDFKNLNYPCEMCGAPTTTGSVCESCHNKVTKDLAEAAFDDSKQDETKKYRTYFTK